MNRRYGEAQYASNLIKDDAQGFIGFELHQILNGERIRVAQVVYWDASGQFTVQTFGTDVAVEIVEELIVETKSSIRLS